MFKGLELMKVLSVAVLTFSITTFAHAQAIMFAEDLGNFPDAIEISAEFGTFNGTINGIAVNATGFLFHLTNTSFGDGSHSAFVRDPDGNFASDDVLTEAAAAAIDPAQPFGIYSLGAGLPVDSGMVTSSPEGFVVDFGDVDPATGLQEINFKIDLRTPNGLIFDGATPVIPSIFTNPRTGTSHFFISTPDGFTPADLPQIRNEPGIDIATEMAWDEGGRVQTKFRLNKRKVELRPRGELRPVEAPPVEEPPVG
jgi:hypothetical protein